MSTPRLDLKMPVTQMRVQLDCTVCDTASRLEVDVYSLDANGVEQVATLVGCIECRSGLARP